MTSHSTTTHRRDPDAPRVRFGIVGAGHVAASFAEDLAHVDGAELAAVASRTIASADEFGRRFPHAHVHTSVDALFDDATIDVVYIAAPHHAHAELAISAMEAGRGVLVEKPFATDASEARRMIETARRHGTFCMEAMWMRFMPAVRSAVDLVRDGEIGTPRMLHADFGVPIADDPTSRFLDPDQGGGALLDRGVYGVSLATMLFGSPTDVVASAAATHTGVDEHNGVVMRFAQGEMAVVSSSLTSLTSNTATITGTHGSITLRSPFFCTDRFDLRRYAPPTAGGGSSRRDDILGIAKRFSLGRLALRVAKPVLGDRASTHRFDSEGHGYLHEARDVVECIGADRRESSVMPLDDTLAVAETIDRIRAAFEV